MKQNNQEHTPSILLTNTNQSIFLDASIPLPSSKSESNRVLIINALQSNESVLENLAAARDTQTMQRLLQQPDTAIWDVLDAGTTMRFLTAYTAILGLPKEMTGTPRMCQRPIGLLVSALKTLGANIAYIGQQGYPPLQIGKFSYTGINKLSIPAGVSSQYISALALVAPYLPEGLTICLEGNIGSWPYIRMTLDLMAHFGIKTLVDGQQIHIPQGKYVAQTFAVESDWSGASYWYSIAALANKAEILLKGLKINSLQGDSHIVQIMENLGVATNFNTEGALLSSSTVTADFISNRLDMSNCPDLAQTLVVLAAAKNWPLQFTGLESLRIKETDRIAALQQELAKFKVHFYEIEPAVFALKGTFTWPSQTPTIATYDDHRMAMAFAPLALFAPLYIENPLVVAKSYPSFWQDLERIGVNSYLSS